MRPTEQTSEPIGDDMARRHGRSAFRALKAHAWCVPRTGLRPLRIAVVVVLGALAVACDDHPNASAQPATSAWAVSPRWRPLQRQLIPMRHPQTRWPRRTNSSRMTSLSTTDTITLALPGSCSWLSRPSVPAPSKRPRLARSTTS